MYLSPWSSFTSTLQNISFQANIQFGQSEVILLLNLQNFGEKRYSMFFRMVICLFVLEFNAILTAKIILCRSVTQLCVSWLYHTRTDAHFLFCIFSHASETRSEKSPKRKFYLRQGIKPTTSRSRVRYATYWATGPGLRMVGKYGSSISPVLLTKTA